MSGAAECYGMPSMRMGLQAINQTRGLAEVISRPRGKVSASVADPSSWFLNPVWPCLNHLVSRYVTTPECLSLLLTPPYSLMPLTVCPPPSLLLRQRRAERKKKRETERERQREWEWDCTLHPLTALSFHAPECDKSRQDVAREFLRVSQPECPRIYL